MKRNVVVFLLSALFAILLSFSILFYMFYADDKRNSSLLSHKTDNFIAHAAGSLNGYRYTNSKEALLHSISKGYQYIELDLYLTVDSHIVCLHNLDEYKKMTRWTGNKLTLEQFLSKKLYGRFTPLTLREAVIIWENNDFIFVTDKISNPRLLNQYFKKDRHKVMVEAFSASDYKSLKEAGYTPMFSTQKDIKGFIRYILARISIGKIDLVTVSIKTKSKYARAYRRLGSKVLLYTLNNDYQARKVLGKEADMIYVDSLVYFNLHN